MGQEIERKFLVKDDTWKQGANGVAYCQGYLNTDKGRTVRVRIAGEKGYLTIKGPTQNGSRLEYEYTIPLEEAREMLERLCISPVVEKVRYTIEYDEHIWEIDEFSGENKGLVIAEIELEAIDQPFSRPPWVGDDVTDDPKYYNSNLARKPYSKW